MHIYFIYIYIYIVSLAMEKNILLIIYLPTNLFIQFLVLYRYCCSPVVHVLYIGSTCM